MLTGGGVIFAKHDCGSYTARHSQSPKPSCGSGTWQRHFLKNMSQKYLTLVFLWHMLKPGVEWSYGVEPWRGEVFGVVFWSGILECFFGVEF